MTELRLALLQINPTVGDIEGNADRILDGILWAHRRGVRLAVFPELCLSGYPPEDLILKQHFVADCGTELRRVAEGTPGGIAVLVGCPMPADGGGAANAAVLIHDGEIRAVYRKRILPNYGVFDEKRVFLAGTEACVAVLDGVRVGIQICEDSWKPGEAPIRDLKRARPDAIVNLSASPYHRGKWNARVDTILAAARATGAPLAYCNLAGGQDELIFDGRSFIAMPDGTLVGPAAAFEEDRLIADLAVGRSRESGAPPAPPGLRTVNLESRPRPAAEPLPEQARPFRSLDPIEEVYAALQTGLRDYVEKNGFSNVIVAVSGGIDSALVACIAADALGAGRVIGLTMPSPFSSEETVNDARALAASLGLAEFRALPIETLFEAYLDLLRPLWPDREPDATEENIQARIRGNLVMALSNKRGCLVLATGNKSELATGYCTLYGDMAGGFAVIKDVPKTLVFELCRWRNRRDDAPVIPPSIIERPPSAELRPNQKDSDALPPYDLLDRILEAYIEKDMGVDDIVRQGLPADIVYRVARMVDRNEYKRRQAPPGIKISPKAFGRDRRMPITNRYRDRIREAEPPVKESP